jgi:tetratricopeptide (TPR) repeat protein
MRSLPLLLFFFCSVHLSYAQPAEDYFLKGIEKFSNNDARGAIEMYNKAISLDPKHVDALYNRGVAKVSIEDYQGAIDDMNRALKIKPKFVNAYYVRGAAKAYLSQYKQALEDMNLLIGIDPEFSKAYTLRAQMKYALKDSAGACRDFGQAVAFGDKDAEKLVATYCTVKDSKGESKNAPVPDKNSNAVVEPKKKEMQPLEIK